MCDNMNLSETTEESEKLGGIQAAGNLSKWLYIMHNENNMSDC